MDQATKRHMLRHFLATLAYRGRNVLQQLPPQIGDFKPSGQVRSPREILNHINGVLTYAHSFMVDYQSTVLPVVEWHAEVVQFFMILKKLDESLENDTPLRGIGEEALLQGPFSDSMLHLGQIGIFRRMAGYPVAAENYVIADIRVGDLTPPESPTDVAT